MVVHKMKPRTFESWCGENALYANTNEHKFKHKWDTSSQSCILCKEAFERQRYLTKQRRDQRPENIALSKIREDVKANKPFKVKKKYIRKDTGRYMKYRITTADAASLKDVRKFAGLHKIESGDKQCSECKSTFYAEDKKIQRYCYHCRSLMIKRDV